MTKEEYRKHFEEREKKREQGARMNRFAEIVGLCWLELAREQKSEVRDALAKAINVLAGELMVESANVLNGAKKEKNE